jgi:hypothetical protein
MRSHENDGLSNYWTGRNQTQPVTCRSATVAVPELSVGRIRCDVLCQHRQTVLCELVQCSGDVMCTVCVPLAVTANCDSWQKGCRRRRDRKTTDRLKTAWLAEKFSRSVTAGRVSTAARHSYSNSLDRIQTAHKNVLKCSHLVPDSKTNSRSVCLLVSQSTHYGPNCVLEIELLYISPNLT